MAAGVVSHAASNGERDSVPTNGQIGSIRHGQYDSSDNEPVVNTNVAWMNAQTHPKSKDHGDERERGEDDRNSDYAFW